MFGSECDKYAYIKSMRAAMARTCAGIDTDGSKTSVFLDIAIIIIIGYNLFRC